MSKKAKAPNADRALAMQVLRDVAAGKAAMVLQVQGSLQSAAVVPSPNDRINAAKELLWETQR